ncbi:hypothetical protein MD537_20600, partial [Flavihumibacter sediminis]|nr:hypothetical protein [Flavihumibacter sediminis]
YGYSLNDDLKGKFEFAYKEGKPFLRVLDTSIKRINPLQTGLRPKPQEQVVPAAELSDVETEEVEPGAAMRIGVVINLHQKAYPGFSVDAIQGETEELQQRFLGKVEKLDLSKYVNLELYPE